MPGYWRKVVGNGTRIGDSLSSLTTRVTVSGGPASVPQLPGFSSWRVSVRASTAAREETNGQSW